MHKDTDTDTKKRSIIGIGSYNFESGEVSQSDVCKLETEES